jgi:hypothetical protein
MWERLSGPTATGSGANTAPLGTNSRCSWQITALLYLKSIGLGQRLSLRSRGESVRHEHPCYETFDRQASEKRRFEDALKRILALEREDFSPSAIADHLQLDEGFVDHVIADFHRWREARRADEGGGGLT